MHPYFIYLLLRTLPPGEQKKLEEKSLNIKPRHKWKQDALNYLLVFIISIACFIMLSTVPYIGPFFFFAGIIGSLYSIPLCIRAILIYKYFDDLFTEENIKKLIDK